MLALSKLARAAVLVLGLGALGLPVQAADLDKLAPGDAEAVLVVNVKSYLDSALFKKYAEEKTKEALKKGPAEDFLKSSGLDPFKDIRTITVTFANYTDKDEFKACVIVRGKLDIQKLQAQIKAEAKKAGESVKITTEEGKTYYTLIPPQGPEITGVFVGDDAMVISNNLDYLKDIANSKKIEGTENSRQLKIALGKVNADQTVYFAGAVTPELRAVIGLLEGWKATVDKVESVTASFNMTDSIEIAAHINTTDPLTARNLGSTLKASVPVLKVWAAANAPAVPWAELLVDNTKITWEGKAVVGRALFSEEAWVSAEERSRKAALTQFLARGNEALKAKRWTMAERIFTGIVERMDPDNEEAKKGLKLTKALSTGFTALEAKKWPDAAAAFNDALKIDPENALAKDGLEKAKAKKS
jgi:hypothetical protein